MISFGLDRAKNLATGSPSKTPESFYLGLWRPRWAKTNDCGQCLEDEDRQYGGRDRDKRSQTRSRPPQEPTAQLEGQLAIAAFFQRFPRIRLADEPLDWRAFPAFRGLAGLSVVVD